MCKNWICRHCRDTIGQVIEGRLFIGDVEIIECVAICPTCGKQRRFVDISGKVRKGESQPVHFGGRLAVRRAIVL